MNVELLKRVADVILARPYDFDMNNFEGPAVESYQVKERERSCGTVACIGGWAAALDKGLVDPIVIDEPFTFYSNVLDLDLQQASRLLLQSGWPYGYLKAYKKAETDQERGEAAYDRIQHFLKTEGKE